VISRRRLDSKEDYKLDTEEQRRKDKGLERSGQESAVTCQPQHPRPRHPPSRKAEKNVIFCLMHMAMKYSALRKVQVKPVSCKLMSSSCGIWRI
jgi:hypothetical protein